MTQKSISNLFFQLGFYTLGMSVLIFHSSFNHFAIAEGSDDGLELNKTACLLPIDAYKLKCTGENFPEVNGFRLEWVKTERGTSAYLKPLFDSLTEERVNLKNLDQLRVTPSKIKTSVATKQLTLEHAIQFQYKSQDVSTQLNCRFAQSGSDLAKLQHWILQNEKTKNQPRSTFQSQIRSCITETYSEFTSSFPHSTTAVSQGPEKVTLPSDPQPARPNAEDEFNNAFGG